MWTEVTYIAHAYTFGGSWRCASQIRYEPLAGTGKEFSNEKAFDRGDSPRHFCGVLQSAYGDRISSDRDGIQIGRRRPRESNGGNSTAPIHAVTLVPRGPDSGDVE